ncbi:helix-turn-helix domain-containing protein [Chryseobacterium sp. DT-3]|uniref:helix-turn-helix domain-containing protein n=1 Tax=Chryseobacterium sp. DT-3 TaxID=3396164 RepID=UPI003F1CD87F
MNAFLMSFSGGTCLLLSFILIFYPLGENLKANRWLALFVFMMGSSFLEISLGEFAYRFIYLKIGHNALQFIMAPSILLSTLYFVDSTKSFGKKDLLHFLPFIIFVGITLLGSFDNRNLITMKLFSISSTNFLVRDILPLQLAVYIILSYLALVRYKKNLRNISVATSGISLNWLMYFLLTLTFVLLFWINDALIGQPQMLKAMPIIYTSAVFFLASFSFRQKVVFETNVQYDKIPFFDSPLQRAPKKERLCKSKLAELSEELNRLISEENIFLDNELSLPVLAGKLGISVHDTSYLINEVTGSNFYNFINSKRVEHAKRILTSGEAKKFNMVGIAFASGFNSKTAFNTAFKKWTGMSPTEYASISSGK